MSIKIGELESLALKAIGNNEAAKHAVRAIALEVVRLRKKGKTSSALLEVCKQVKQFGFAYETFNGSHRVSIPKETYDEVLAAIEAAESE